MKGFGAAWLTACLLIPTHLAAAPPSSAPFIFVKPTADGGKSGAGLAWWLHDFTARTSATTLFGKPVAEWKQSWCRAEPLSAAAYISEDPATQDAINATFMKDGPTFELKGTFGYPEPLVATIGIFQDCDGESGNFLIIRRARDGSLVYFNTFDSTALQAIVPDSEGLRWGDCWECGFERVLSYDAGHRRFYWFTRPEGDE